MGLRDWRRSGVAAAVTGLLIGAAGAPPATANPDNELIWEEGTVTSVADGDTLVATMDAGPGARGSQRVRTIGVQAPETSPEECGAAQAKDRLRGQLPVGARVQTRSVDVRSNDDYSGGRIVRSLYAQDEEGNWYDTSRGTVSDGWLMWFPLAADSSNKPEWAHNLEYRVLADDAAGQGRGLWSANLCGGSPYPGADLRVWAKYWGTERVYVENRNGYDVDLSGWTIRDSAISGYRTLPAGTVVPAGQVREVYTGDLNLNNLPADNPAFEGDAVYLMDNTGPYRTGNLRAWFPYPCNPDQCGDVLAGGITMSAPALNGQPQRKPSSPGTLTATASTAVAGRVDLTWAAPTDLGAPSVTYTVTTTSSDGGSVPPPATGVATTTHTVTGLTPGKSYTFSVKAVNGAGESASVQSSPAVTPAGLPGPPTNVVTEGRDLSIVTSWTAGDSGATDADAITYTATATTGGAVAGTCTSTGATSCTIPNLIDGTYTVSVVAANTVGASAASAPSAPVTIPAAHAPGGSPLGKPTSVVAIPGNTKAVVSWTRPGNDGGAPITSYTVAAEGDPSKTCTATGGTTSCVVPGLANGTSYRFVVTANNGASGPASDPSPSITPFAYSRASAPTPAPPAAEPWIGGQYVDITNTTGSVARLGGYGLWDAKSSRYVNGGSVENRAAYLFDPALALGANETLRVYFVNGTSANVAVSGVSKVVFAGTALELSADSDFVELANLNGAQVACRSRSGASCERAKVTSVPSSPVGITARTTASSVTVNWGAPISRGGTAITAYTATAFDAPVGGNVIGGCSAGGDGRSCSFPGGIGTRYYVEVTATNGVGVSGPSWRVLAAPRTVPSAPGNVAVSGTPGGLKISWTPAAENGAAITRYTASVYTAGTGGSPVRSCTTSNGSLTECTVLSLQGGTTYFVDVTATNRAGVGPASTPRVAGQPGPGGAISTYSKGKVTVRWDAPTPGSNTVSGYVAKLYTKASGGTKVGECTAPAGATQCTTKKMRKRSKYYIELTMRSAAGDFTIKPRIVTGPPKKPGKPTVTSATPSGRSAVIAWAPPSFTGYSYLKSYGARLYSKSRGGSVKASCTANAGTVTCTTKALKRKGTYYAAVRVKNSKGWSSWSKRVKVVVP